MKQPFQRQEIVHHAAVRVRIRKLLRDKRARELVAHILRNQLGIEKQHETAVRLGHVDVAAVHHARRAQPVPRRENLRAVKALIALHLALDRVVQFVHHVHVRMHLRQMIRPHQRERIIGNNFLHSSPSPSRLFVIV